MKTNIYEVKLTDESNKTADYKVKITGSPIQNGNSTPRRRKLVFSYLTFFVLCGLMFTSFFMKCSTCKDENKKDLSYEVSIDEVELKISIAVLKKADNIIPLICMTIFCTAGVVFVCLVLIKDDGGLRFHKLNSLMSLRERFESKNDFEVTEDECKICPLKQAGNDSAMQNCCKKTTKKKNLYGEITKTLMNSITEI